MRKYSKEEKLGRRQFLCRSALPHKLKPEREGGEEPDKAGSPAWESTASKAEYNSQALVWGKFYLVEPQKRKLYLPEEEKELLTNQLSDVSC